MKITNIVYSPLETGTESEFFRFFLHSLINARPFLRNATTENVYTQQKSARLSVSLLFFGGLVRIPRYPKNFQSKNVFLSSTKSDSTQTQTRNEIVFEYFVSKYRRRKLLLPVAFDTLPSPDLDRLHPPAIRVYSTSKLCRRISFERLAGTNTLPALWYAVEYPFTVCVIKTLHNAQVREYRMSLTPRFSPSHNVRHSKKNTLCWLCRSDKTADKNPIAVNPLAVLSIIASIRLIIR